MYSPIKVIEIDLGDGIEPQSNLYGYHKARIYVRLFDIPLGVFDLPVTNNQLATDVLEKKIIDQFSWQIAQVLLRKRLGVPLFPGDQNLEDLVNYLPLADDNHHCPMVTVAVCTRNRTNDLKLCLKSLEKIDYPNLEVIIVDNAPDDKQTKFLVESDYPHFIYVEEPRPGLDWARNRAALEAKGEIIAYTDDDVIVDPNWVSALVSAFEECPEAMCVTGLVIPHELETSAQHMFEEYGGFGRGFEQTWNAVDKESFIKWAQYGTGQYGTGANMAFRLSLFSQIGLFDPALDVGTATHGGGDLEMFFRVLVEGYTLIYQPSSIVRHRHRKSYAGLKEQLSNNSLGLMSYFVKSQKNYPAEKFAIWKIAIWWIVYWCFKRIIFSYIFPSSIPREIMFRELFSSFDGLFRYKRAKARNAEIVQEFGPHPSFEDKSVSAVKLFDRNSSFSVGIFQIDLLKPIPSLEKCRSYKQSKIFVNIGKRLLGSIEIENAYCIITRSRICKEVANNFFFEIYDQNRTVGKDGVWDKYLKLLKAKFISATNNIDPLNLAQDKISIVIASYDRPNSLDNCLEVITSMATEFEVEIIVVDNHPSSGLTPPIVAKYPTVKLVIEYRQGLAFARNAGIIASTGTIIVSTDDDVIVSEYWLENLIAPFVDPEVKCVCGNVLPIELEHEAQIGFEKYGGLGRGQQKFSVDRSWFDSFKWHSVPTWTLGAAANTAYRASIFSDEQIGLLEETLGPGMPSGVGEDTYLMYKVLKAGHTIAYEPSAFVWHHHRRTLKALRKQLFDYSKGHVAYHLTTFQNDRDIRGLFQIFIHLPLWRINQLWLHFFDLISGRILRGQGHQMFTITLIEIMGNLAGFYGFWRSKRRVRKIGRSKAYRPVYQRGAIEASKSEDTSAVFF